MSRMILIEELSVETSASDLLCCHGVLAKLNKSIKAIILFLYPEFKNLAKVHNYLIANTIIKLSNFI